MADLADGESCDESSDCNSGHCHNMLCCEAGFDCCLSGADCPPPQPSHVCDAPASCQGHAVQAVCSDFKCTPAEEEDDTGCDENVVAVACAPYLDVTCTGQADQEPPETQCADTCNSDKKCAEHHVCTKAEECEPVICELSGGPGDKVDCLLHLARESLDAAPAVQLQLELRFPWELATADSLEACGALSPPFEEYPCTTEGGECGAFGDPDIFCGPESGVCEQCHIYAVDEDNAELATGHMISTCSQPPPSCAAGSFELLFWTAESAPLSEAVVADELVAGRSRIVAVRFELLEELAEPVPVTVSDVDFVAAAADASTLPVQVRHFDPPNPPYVVVSGVP